jgi:hypothetical protein
MHAVDHDFSDTMRRRANSRDALPSTLHAALTTSAEHLLSSTRGPFVSDGDHLDQ